MEGEGGDEFELERKGGGAGGVDACDKDDSEGTGGGGGRRAGTMPGRGADQSNEGL